MVNQFLEFNVSITSLSGNLNAVVEMRDTTTNSVTLYTSGSPGLLLSTSSTLEANLLIKKKKRFSVILIHGNKHYSPLIAFTTTNIDFKKQARARYGIKLKQEEIKRRNTSVSIAVTSQPTWLICFFNLTIAIYKLPLYSISKTLCFWKLKQAVLLVIR